MWYVILYFHSFETEKSNVINKDYTTIQDVIYHLVLGRENNINTDFVKKIRHK